MDFTFILSSKNKSYISDKLAYDYIKFIGNESVIRYNEGVNIDFDANSLIAISGSVKIKGKTFESSLNEFKNCISSNEWPVRDEFSGAFSGFIFENNEVKVFNDPIGLYKIYYAKIDEMIIVSTRINDIFVCGNFEINYSSWFLELTAPEYSQYGTNTVLKNVKSLLPGELKVIPLVSDAYSLFDTTIKQEDKEIDIKVFANDLVEFINVEFRDFYDNKEELTIPMSGGVDSRVVLAPFLNIKKRIKLTNYGQKGIIDSTIPEDIAKKMNFSFEFVDINNDSFPSKEFLIDLVCKTDSVHVNSWFGHLKEKQLNNSKKELLLLGDMCDILRSKGAESIKNRKFRKSYYIKNFFKRSKIKLNKLSVELKIEFQNKKKSTVINNLEKVIEEIKFLPMPIEELKSHILSDMNELFNHMERYSPKYIESYEELFGILTHGRRSMGKQLNLLKYAYLPEIPLLNIRIVRKVLNYSPSCRYSDELTCEMFKTKKWKVLGDFPTSQNPMIAYNSNYYLMLFGWFLRSSIDQILTKITMKGFINRTRIFKNLNSKEIYLNPGSYERFVNCLENGEVDIKNKLQIFEGRRDGKLWPLASMDLMPILQGIVYLKLFKNK